MSFPLVSPKEWITFLLKFDVQKESQVKKIALILYYARIACYANCDSMITFLAMDDHSVIKKYIKEIEKLKKDNGLTVHDVKYFTSDEKAVEHMKEFEEGDMSFEEILEKGKTPKKKEKSSPKAKKVKTISEEKVSSPKSAKAEKIKKVKKSSSPDKSPKSAKAEKIKKVKKSSSPGKSPKSAKAEKIKKVKKSSSPGKSPKSAKAEKIKKAITKKSTPKKTSEKDTVMKKNCNRYTIADLKKLASENGLHIPSGLKKVDICELVKDAGLLDIVIPVVDNSAAEKKFVKSHYIYNSEDVIIGTKKSGKYLPLAVEDRLLLDKLKIPFKFATNKEIEKLFFFADAPQSKIAYNILGNKNPFHMTLPPVPAKDRKKSSPTKFVVSDEVKFERKKLKNATKNAKFEKKFEDRQMISKRV
jgi:hypothetical protein